MKNKSFKHPFPTFEDKMFDGNKDGQLDTFETIFRDAHLDEMYKNNDINNEIKTHSQLNQTSNKTPEVSPEDAGYVLLISIITIALVVLAIVAFIAIESDLIRTIIFLAIVWAAACFFKSSINKSR